MDGLLQAATDLAALLPASRIKAIADRLRNMAAPESSENLHHLVNAPNTQAALDQLIVARKQAGVSGEVLAGVLMGASVAYRRAQSDRIVSHNLFDNHWRVSLTHPHPEGLSDAMCLGRGG